MRRITYLLVLSAVPLLAAPVKPSAKPVAKPAAAAVKPMSQGDVDKRVDAIMAKLSLEQKIDLIGGVDGFFVRGYENLGWPRLKMADGPMGTRNFGPSAAYAAGIGLAAAWDPQLARETGEAIGQDARAKGVHFMLGPGVNIYRTPKNGRNFEYFGEDPFLAARTTVGYIKGIQSQGVIATVKHFAANNSEFDRNGSNSQVDERTLREIYLPAFEAAVKEAKVGSIMDSYNLINGDHATQNHHLNNEIAKQDWGFRGVIMSDWDATYDGVAAANGGLDLEMPSGKFMNQKTLLPAIKEGKVSVATIDDKVRRIIRTAVEFGFLDRDQRDLNIPRYNEAHRKVALKGAEEAAVLLKNEGVLPLSKHIKTLAVLGPNAYPAQPVGGGSAAVQPFDAVSGLQGLSQHLAPGAKVLYEPGILSLEEIFDRCSFKGEGGEPVLVERFTSPDATGTPVKTSREGRISFQSAEPIDWANYNARKGSLRYTTSYVATKSGAHRWFVGASGRDTFKLFVDGKLVMEQPEMEGQTPTSFSMNLEAGRTYAIKFELGIGSAWGTNRAGVAIVSNEDLITPEAKKLAAMADAAIVMVGFDQGTESEGFDRNFALPGGQDELIQAVSAVNKKTLVTLTSGGAVDASAWIDKAPALLHTWYAGQEGGRALANIVFGDVNPSGHLPMTWERSAADNPTAANYLYNNGEKNIQYREGLFVGYRGYEKKGVKPLFPFGHGLSYTCFAYKNLKISPASPKVGQDVTVSFDVTNTGKVAGADVPQLYLGNPTATVERPAKELKGFQRVTLKPGQTQRVTLKLDPRAHSFYDVATKAWKQDAGTYTVSVGHSSADITLKGEYQVSK